MTGDDISCEKVIGSRTQAAVEYGPPGNKEENCRRRRRQKRTPGLTRPRWHSPPKVVADTILQPCGRLKIESRVTQGDPQFVSTLEVLAAILRNTNREREALEVEGRLKTAQDTTMYR